jgi:hypothetical protein
MLWRALDDVCGTQRALGRLLSLAQDGSGGHTGAIAGQNMGDSRG